MSDDSIIDNGDSIFSTIDLPEDFSSGYMVDAISDAKREALHKVILALYAAKKKGMGIAATIQALRDFKAESTDDFGMAIHEFDPEFWGYLG